MLNYLFKIALNFYKIFSRLNYKKIEVLSQIFL